jgi:F-type H+-transporting ATPase subunit alpha
MRSVSGSLRVDLAQFRDLEAFAAFASDLDDASKAQLSRGQRMVEILKQGQYEPYPVEEQVAAIWIGTSGSVDDVPVADVRRFEKEFISFLKTDHAGILGTIRETGQLSDDTVSAFKDAVAEFKRGFQLGDGTLLADQGKAEAMDADNVGQATITKHVKAR